RDRLGSERASTAGLGERSLELRGSVLGEQMKQPSGRAAEVAAVHGDLLEERCSTRTGRNETMAPPMLAGASLLVGETLEMHLGFDLPSALPRARVACDLSIAVEDAHGRIGGD